MKKILKWLLGSLAALLLLIVAAVAAITLLIDPNGYKAEMETLAKEQGVVLSLKGELAWQFYPQLGIVINNVSIATESEPTTPLAVIEHAALSVQLLPLFSGKVNVAGIVLDKADINLSVGKDGVGNWSKLMKKDSTQASAAKSDSPSGKLVIAVQKLAISNSQLSYRDEPAGKSTLLSAFNLQASDVVLDKQAFPFSLKTKMSMSQTAKPTLNASIDMNGKVAIDEATGQVSFSDATLAAVLGDEKLQAPVELSLAMVVTPEPFGYKGHIKTATFNAGDVAKVMGIELSEMASPTALDKLSLEADIAAEGNALALDNMTMQMDDTAFSGKVAITDMEKSILDVHLRGNKINADHYLAPAAPATTAAVGKSTPAPATASAENNRAAEAEAIIPVETVRGLAMDVDVSFEQMTLKGLPLTEFTTQVAAHNAVVQVKNFKASLHGKPLHVVSTIDARPALPAISFDVTGTGLPVGQLLHDFQIEERVSGDMDIKAVGKTAGIYQSQLINNMDAKVELHGKQFQLAEMNVEQSVCNLLAQVQGKTLAPQNWDSFTRLRDTSLRMTISQGVATIESLQAGVEKIAVASTGTVNLRDNAFDMRVAARLSDPVMNDKPGCEVTNKKLLNRDLPLRCRGTFADIGAKTCLPDVDAIKSIAKEQAKEALQEQTDKAKTKVNEELERALKKQLGDDSGKTTTELLKGLFKKP